MGKTARSGGGRSATKPPHRRSRDVSRMGRQLGTIDARSVSVSSGRKNIPRDAGEECVVRGRGWAREGAGGGGDGLTRSGDGGGHGRGSR
jgi:hypothetical protein